MYSKDVKIIVQHNEFQCKFNEYFIIDSSCGSRHWVSWSECGKFISVNIKFNESAEV